MPPSSYLENSTNSVTTRFVKTATNKMRCPIFTLAWTPEGRRLVTGASSGEFTLWNGLTFNFETILQVCRQWNQLMLGTNALMLIFQAHEVPVRCMVWSNNDSWMVTGDHNGYVKYWQSNMNNVKQYQAHKEPVRGIRYRNEHFLLYYFLETIYFLLYSTWVLLLRFSNLKINITIKNVA